MRPQIRSLPLCKVECPQFSWAVRNNSENVSVVLQPDLHPYEEKRNVLIGDDESAQLKRNKSCYCSEENLRPTLFPHPVSCVCSNEPRPPENEKYRYCELKMDQAIGDVMEEIIMETIPTSPSTYAPRMERVMKKIMRSAYLPDQVDLTDDNTCVICPAKDPTLLKEFLDGLKYQKYPGDRRDCSKICMETEECKKRSKANDCDCIDNSPTEPELSEDKRCKWKKDSECFCKQLRHDLCVNCSRCRCKCGGTCLKCTCQEKELQIERSKSIDPSKKSVTIDMEQQIEKKNEKEVSKTEKSSKKVLNEKDSDETDVPSTEVTRKGGKPRKAKAKPPKKSRAKSPAKKSQWKRPNNIICERFEFVENNPFYSMQEPKEKSTKRASLVPVYEHYGASCAGRHEGSKRPLETVETQNLNRPKGSNTPKNLVTKSLSSTKNSNRTKANQKKPGKMPWNWNNQSKVDDPYKQWGGTRYSWSKKLNYSTLNKNMEENNENLNRSRGGDDEIASSGMKGPRYYEYKPNLRPKSFNQFAIPDNEEEIKKKEQRRYRNGYGKMRVKSWHQTLEENTGNDAKKDEEPLEGIKEKYEFSENNSEEDNREATDDESHDKDQCLQCLMSDVQQRIIGSSNNLCPHGAKEGSKNNNFKSSSKMLADCTNVRTLESEDVANEEPGNMEDLPGRRLPTIFEENSGKNGGERNGSVKTIRPHSVGKPGEDFYPCAMKERPKSAEISMEDSSINPFFNVIKQRIHSRSRTLENLDRFRNEIFTKKTDSEHTCLHRFTLDERLYPKPLHCDESGTSCCVHCDKPMTSSEKSVFLDQRESKERVGDGKKAQKQVSKFSLRQKPVHMGAKNSVLELRLRPEHDDLLKTYGGEKGRKREFYADSLALRHQRR